MKAQSVRLLDVFVLGPFTIWAATQEKLSPVARTALVTYGIGTITYNAKNYVKVKNRKRRNVF